MIGVIGDVKNYVFFFKLLSRSRFPLVRFELSRVALGSSMIFWPVRHILRVSQVLGCELSKEGAKRHGLEKEWMTGPINALRCRIVGPYALPDAAARYRKSCEKLGTNYMYLNMIYRIWGDTCLKKESTGSSGSLFWKATIFL